MDDTRGNQWELGFWQGYAEQILRQRDAARVLQGSADRRYNQIKVQRDALKRQRDNARRKLQAYKDRMARHNDRKVRACVRKKYFASREEAQCHIEINNECGQLLVYNCEYCDGHHLATKHKHNQGE